MRHQPDGTAGPTIARQANLHRSESGRRHGGLLGNVREASAVQRVQREATATEFTADKLPYDFNLHGELTLGLGDVYGIRRDHGVQRRQRGREGPLRLSEGWRKHE